MTSRNKNIMISSRTSRQTLISTATIQRDLVTLFRLFLLETAMRQAIRSNLQLSARAKQVQGFQRISRACLTSSSPAASATNPAGADQPQKSSKQPVDESTSPEQKLKESGQPRKKTMAELDEELRLKLEGMSGDGGSAGVEYEGGKAEGLKRGVKSNMFRVI